MQRTRKSAMARREKQKLNLDMISSLPDSLLCHILSFLPTENSVATCVLSRRWRHLWKYLQVFHFSSQGKTSDRFVDFVDKVLSLRRVDHIQKFSLSIDVTDIYDAAAMWLRAVVNGPQLQELRISVPMVDLEESDEPKESDGFHLPKQVFTSTTLVSLFLYGGIIFANDSFPPVHLPSLKNLDLNIACVCGVNGLLSGCPVLETLKVCKTISCGPSMHMPPSLKSLTFDDETQGETNWIEIHTPSLEYLHFNFKSDCYSFSVRNLHNVLEAHVDMDYDEYVAELLKELCIRTELLELTVAATECLLRSRTLDFPEFGCLLHLHLGIPYFDSVLLSNILFSCRMLQVLIIRNVQGLPPQHNEPTLWTRPTIVPTCVVSHLETFKFGGYQDFADEHAFVTYILERGLVLKTMTIRSKLSMNLKKKYDILKGLSKISRGSTMCQLEFD